MKKGTKEEKRAEAPIHAKSDIAEKISDNEGKVGGMLRDARTKKGYSLDEAAKELCIRKSFLEAIESSNYEEIPEPPYGIGFIRSYAEFLGLNSSRIVQLFKEETDAKNQKEDVYVLEPQAEATMPNKKYLAISVLAVVLLYAIWLGYNKTQFEEEASTTGGEYIIAEVSVPQQTEENFPLQVEDFATVDDNTVKSEALPVIDTTTIPAEENSQVIVSEENFVETSKEAPSEEVAEKETQKTEEKKVEEKQENKAETTEKQANTKEGSRVTIKVNKETWVEVKDNKKLWLSKVLQAGDSYRVPAGEGTILSVGRFDAVDVEIDGKVVPGVFTAGKKTGIVLDKYLSANH